MTVTHQNLLRYDAFTQSHRTFEYPPNAKTLSLVRHDYILLSEVREELNAIVNSKHFDHCTSFPFTVSTHPATSLAMEHFAPHPKSAFEGYYSKFDLTSGAHIVLVICTVPKATALPPHMVSLTYYPASGKPIFQREHWVSSIERIQTGPNYAFELRIPELGTMSVDTDSTTTYDLSCGEWSLNAMTAGRTPWKEKKETPEGWLIKLPLPLHWHVHSLSSPAAFQFNIPSIKIPRADQKGRATIHQEKNWANSFPESHIWIQARDPTTSHSICLAGGKILGMQALILGYRSESVNLDFLPPFALSLLGVSPFMSFKVDYENRAVSISVSNFWQKINVRARAPKEEGWFGLGAPFPEGHRHNFCTESFLANVEVDIYERQGWWGWKQVQHDKFESASLEFAGGYFPGRGEKKRV